jgi:soluble lytic murein transglycosylase-like protein
VTVYDGPAVFTNEGAAPIAVAPGRGLDPRPASSGASIDAAARRADLSPDLVAAVAWRESGFRPGVVSKAGAIGEMQLMPATARALGVDPWDSRDNYKGGAAYLGALMAHYDGDLVRSLAAYNAGPGAVDRYGGVPPFKETQAYVASVLDRMSRQSRPASDKAAK